MTGKGAATLGGTAYDFISPTITASEYSVSIPQSRQTIAAALRWRDGKSPAPSQRHFGDVIPVFLLGIGAEQHLDAGGDAGAVEPDFRALGVEPQQRELGIVLALVE